MKERKRLRERGRYSEREGERRRLRVTDKKISKQKPLVSNDKHHAAETGSTLVNRATIWRQFECHHG